MAQPDGVGYDVVVVGTSWGGLAALRALVGGLPKSLDMAVTLVQHRHKDSDHILRALIQERSEIEVCEVEDKMSIEHGRIFIAPPDYHTLLEDGYFSLSTEAPVRYSRPSIDVTFHSAAHSYGHRAVGIILTGANSDGSDGLLSIFRRGGMTIVQDPETAESRLMPDAALRVVPRAKVMKIGEMPEFLSMLPTHSNASGDR